MPRPPFDQAVCKSKKSWQARHTGIKIVQQISILMGCAILPHLKSLVEIIEHGRLVCIRYQTKLTASVLEGNYQRMVAWAQWGLTLHLS